MQDDQKEVIAKLLLTTLLYINNILSDCVNDMRIACITKLCIRCFSHRIRTFRRYRSDDHSLEVIIPKAHSCRNNRKKTEPTSREKYPTHLRPLHGHRAC